MKEDEIGGETSVLCGTVLLPRYHKTLVTLFASKWMLCCEFELLPADVTAVSVVLVSSRRIVGYVGCNRKSLLMSGSAAAIPGVTCKANVDSDKDETNALYAACLKYFRICLNDDPILHTRLTVALVAFFCALIGPLPQKRKADWPVEVEIAEGSKERRGHTNSAVQKICPLAPSTTCA